MHPQVTPVIKGSCESVGYPVSRSSLRPLHSAPAWDANARITCSEASAERPRPQSRVTGQIRCRRCEQSTVQYTWPMVDFKLTVQLCVQSVDRDEICVVTGGREPHVAHIYPFSAINSSYRETLRYALAQIWGGQRGPKLADQLFHVGHGGSGIDQLGNFVYRKPPRHLGT